MADRDTQLRAIADAAQVLAPAMRPAFLDRACGDDPVLRQAVEARIAAREAARNTPGGHATDAEESNAAATHRDQPPMSGISGAGTKDDPLPGQSRETGQEATEHHEHHRGETAAPPASGSGHGGSAWHEPARFAPGTMVAGRYRIIGLLGHGERGEVYRADDLKVGQSVALKFLRAFDPSRPETMGRVLNELRLARQVAHANVCRVFDIGRFEDEALVAMEFIDGENLESLLRRIGRLPRDKVVQIARQMCAGLAAAHDQGLLHRDLTPRNVMIDGRGHVRIIDFGVADATRPPHTGNTVSSQTGPADSLYHAPEQRAREATTPQSDLYALGAIVYEMVTGEAPPPHGLDPDTDEVHTSLLPESVAEQIDPKLERVIRRCLQRDPQQRPPSAHATMAALPGGDPLGAALAAGQTPSPQLVAAAGRTEGLKPASAAGLLGTGLAALIAVILLAGQTFLLPQAGMELPTAVLADRAREVLADIGHEPAVAHRVSGWLLDSEAMQHQQRTQQQDWADPHAPAVAFWYRQSPSRITPLNPLVAPSLEDPPTTRAGMATLQLSPSGSLLSLRVVPEAAGSGDQQADSRTVPDDLPWSTLFRAAGLERQQFEPVEPSRDPAIYADTVRAWLGEGTHGQPLHVQGAALRGRVVEFEVLRGWELGEVLQGNEAAGAKIDRPEESWQVGAARTLRMILFFAVLSGGLLLAWYNLQHRRGDRVGAFRVGLFIFISAMLTWLLIHRFTGGGAGEMRVLLARIAMSLFLAAVVWVYYTAMEPYLRRLWPQTVISWTRLLSGRWRDPLVGRDVLIGGIFGTGIVLMLQLEVLLAPALGTMQPLPLTPPPREPLLAPLLGTAPAIGTLVNLVGVGIWLGFTALLLALLLRVILRRTWLAGLAFCLLTAGLMVMASEARGVLAWGFALVIFSGATWVLMRVGLLAAVTAAFFCLTLLAHPVTADTSAWYAGVGLLGPGLLAAVLAVAFYHALGGHSVLRGLLGDDAHGVG